jgi:hypothetical protein
MPRFLSYVKLSPAGLRSAHYEPEWDGDDVFVWFGEISNMPMHCVVMKKETGKFYTGWHCDNFVELTSEEV